MADFTTAGGGFRVPRPAFYCKPVERVAEATHSQEDRFLSANWSAQRARPIGCESSRRTRVLKHARLGRRLGVWREDGDAGAAEIVHGGQRGGGFVERGGAVDEALGVELAGGDQSEQGRVGVGGEAVAAGEC